MMTLLLALGTVIFPQVSCDRGVCVVNLFVKRAKIPTVESKTDSCTNMFGVINCLGALQNDQLKNDHPLGVLLPMSYAI